MKKKLFKTVTVHSCESMSTFYACVALSLHSDKTVKIKHPCTLSDLKVEREKPWVRYPSSQVQRQSNM